MHIRLLKSFTYPYGPGGLTRTLPEGQTFNEPAEIAEYAIEHGFAEPIEQLRREPVLISDEFDPDLDGEDDDDPGTEDPVPEPAPEPGPAPDPDTTVPAEPGRRSKKGSGEVEPADPVEPA